MDHRPRSESSGPASILEKFRGDGCLVRDGHLGAARVAVVATAYALDRMTLRDIDVTLRDIDVEEVCQILALPRSSHGRGKSAGRFEVSGTIGKRQLRIVYEKPARGVVKVITA
ncbi:MAG: hypothetical protein ABSG65_17980 [Bryobacteraceae bacterium]